MWKIPQKKIFLLRKVTHFILCSGNNHSSVARVLNSWVDVKVGCWDSAVLCFKVYSISSVPSNPTITSCKLVLKQAVDCNQHWSKLLADKASLLPQKISVSKGANQLTGIVAKNKLKKKGGLQSFWFSSNHVKYRTVRATRTVPVGGLIHRGSTFKNWHKQSKIKQIKLPLRTSWHYNDRWCVIHLLLHFKLLQNENVDKNAQTYTQDLLDKMQRAGL